MNPDIKIILVAPIVEPVGVTVHIFNLAKLLKYNGWLDTVVCPNYGWLTSKLEKNNISFVVLDISIQPLKFIKSNNAFFEFLKSRNDSNIVHLHGRFPLFVSFKSIVFLKKYKFAITIHQFSSAGSRELFSWKKRLETLFLNFTNGICCVSNALKTEVRERVTINNNKKIVVIGNWIEPIEMKRKALTRSKTNRAKEKIKICSIGRLSKEKGFDVLVKSLDLLRKNGINFECDIFGEGPERLMLKDLIKGCGLDGIVRLKGESYRIRKELTNYDVLIVPSRTESFGIVVLEAYDAGIPVIASNVPGLNETIISNKTGLLFKSESALELKKSIVKLMNSEKMKNKFSVNGRKYLRAKYVLNSHLIERFKKFYSGVLKDV